MFAANSANIIEERASRTWQKENKTWRNKKKTASQIFISAFYWTLAQAHDDFGTDRCIRFRLINQIRNVNYKYERLKINLFHIVFNLEYETYTHIQVKYSWKIRFIYSGVKIEIIL